MSIVRDIPTTSQHSAEPNLAITAGFGSVALSAPTNIGGLDGSICSTQHREEGAVCDQFPVPLYVCILNFLECVLFVVGV